MQKSSSNNSFNKNEISTVSTTSNSSQSTTVSNTADVQAQFELLVELRRFINIDLFQRGYYQVRVSIKCGNKQVPIKVVLQLENNKNNQNLSDSMFPSCVLDEYAISKTFLILYRNEEINLDDQILFKISTLVNAFNLVESFERLDLQLFIELWFTENDYKPLSSILSLNSDHETQNSNQTTSFTNLNNSTSNNSASINSNSTNTINNNNNNNGMQLLCSRLFKVHFEPRQGIHIQLPVIFDYFHLSSVLVTIHCTLLTLLPPVAIGTNIQRSSTLSTILFGKDLSKMRSIDEINPGLMKRAAHLHNQICGLLLSSYEYLQDHILKMSAHLDDFKRKNLEINEYVDCQDKLKKISDIIDQCTDPETLDDLANRHVAQCSAENIMQWCTYMENFSLNQQIAPYLATEYHSKRLKRFSESFFTKDLQRKNLHEYEFSDNYVSLNDLIRQSTYYQQLPELIIACDDLDGTPDNIPIIFEDNFVSNIEQTNVSSSPISSNSSIFSSSDSMAKKNNNNMFMRANSLRSSKQRKGSVSSNEMSVNSANLNQLSDSNKQLHKKLKKKIINGDVISNDRKKSVQLVSYRKVNDYFNDQISMTGTNVAASSNNTDSENVNSGGSSTSVGSGNTSFYDSQSQQTSVQSKLKMIKADLSTRVLTPPGSHRNISNNNNSSLQSIIETKLLNKQAASATDLFKKSFNRGHHLENMSSSPLIATKLIKQQSVNNSSTNDENLENKPSFQSLTNLSSATSDYSSSATTTNDNNQNEQYQTNGSEQESLESEITDSINQIDLSVNSDETSSTVSETYLEQNSENGHKNNLNVLNNKQGPSDCSFKSRALYESFRGKPSTLERPRTKTRMNLNNLTNNDTLVKRNRDTSKKTIAEFLAMDDDEDDDLDNSKIIKQIEDKKPNSGKTIGTLKRQLTINTDKNSLSAILNENLYRFVVAKEDLKRAIMVKYQGNIYSEFSSLFCTSPYFYSDLTPKLSPSNSFSNNQPKTKTLAKNSSISLRHSFISKSKLLKLFSRHDNNEEAEVQDHEQSEENQDEEEEKLHLVVCVHGLDGNGGDLRLVRTYIELALPGAKIDFLMSEQNQDNTFDDIEMMTKQLIKEINEHIEIFGIEPDRISFIGHSLGNLIVRSTVAHDDFKPYINKLHCYLSLSGPHLGTLYNSSGLINMGMWIMQKWKKSGSLLQLSLKDHSDLQKTFLYKLSTKPTFEYFKHVLLVASPQDRYVPFHSARIEMCKAAIKDNVYGNIYREMVTNILKPIQSNPNITFKRYSAFHSLPSGTNNFIGRAAHIAVLDSELFVEKLILVSVAKYFR